MSGFTGEGFVPFPNTIADLEQIHSVTEWPTERLDYKTNEYGAFLQRDDLMPRAVAAASKILDYLLFELESRDGAE